MTKQHPITPPPGLVDKIFMLEASEEGRLIAAYRAGADQELEACIKLLSDLGGDGGMIRRYGEMIRSYRRPKPLSLKEQALAIVENLGICDHLNPQDENTIRRALEQLDD